MRIPILGISVDSCSRLEFRIFLRRCLTEKRAHRVVTCNPEIALAARRDPRYGATVRTSDFISIDGFGIVLALRALGHRAATRITGSDIFDDICTLAAEEGRGVTFLLREGGLTAPELLRAALARRWPNLRASVAAMHPKRIMDPALARAIMDHEPEFLIVNFGHPEQEQWIAEHLDHFRSVRVAVGIGGAVDYRSGAVPLPPTLVRRLGVEWLWRLLRQPRRLRRIVRATLMFPWVVATDVATQWARTHLPLRLRSKSLT